MHVICFYYRRRGSFKNTTSSYFQHTVIHIKTILALVPWLLTIILISKCSSTTHWFTSICYISDAYDFVWSTRNFYLVHTRASISIFCVVLFSAQEISCRKKKKTRVINLSERWRYLLLKKAAVHHNKIYKKKGRYIHLLRDASLIHFLEITISCDIWNYLVKSINWK